MCQYPISDNSHFYIVEILSKNYSVKCQYPISDNSHFYGIPLKAA